MIYTSLNPPLRKGGLRRGKTTVKKITFVPLNSPQRKGGL